MSDHVLKINDMLTQHFCCSQIIISLALDLKGSENEEVRQEILKAMSGLCRGMESGKDCGALTGAACAVGLICGRGGVDEAPHDKFNKMIKGLVEWFEDEYEYVECSALTGGNVQKQREICPGIIETTFENLLRIMQENGTEMN